MNKRILLIAVVAIGAIALYTLLHKQFNNNNQQNELTMPVTASVLEPNLETPSLIIYKDLANFLKKESGKHLLFITDESQDTTFISNSVLMPLLGEFDTPINMNITKVDMTNTEDVSVVNLKKALNIEKYPGFVLVESNSDTKSYEILSTLIYISEDPFTTEELKTWFFDNGIWTGPYGKN